MRNTQETDVVSQKIPVMTQSATVGEWWDDLPQEIANLINSIRASVQDVCDECPEILTTLDERTSDVLVLNADTENEIRLVAYLPEGKEARMECIIIVDVDNSKIHPTFDITPEDRENSQSLNNILSGLELNEKEQEEHEERQRTEDLKSEIYDELDGDDTSSDHDDICPSITQTNRESRVKKLPSWEFIIISIYTDGRRVDGINLESFR